MAAGAAAGKRGASSVAGLNSFRAMSLHVVFKGTVLTVEGAFVGVFVAQGEIVTFTFTPG